MPAKIKKKLFANAGTAAIEFGLITLFLLILLAGAIKTGFFIWQQMEDYVAAQAGLDLTDGIYFPSQFVIFSNRTGNPSGCTELIAGTMKFTGGATFLNNCSRGVLPHNGGVSLLVE